MWHRENRKRSARASGQRGHGYIVAKHVSELTALYAGCAVKWHCRKQQPDPSNWRTYMDPIVETFNATKNALTSAQFLPGLEGGAGIQVEIHGRWPFRERTGSSLCWRNYTFPGNSNGRAAFNFKIGIGRRFC